jgi:ornithine cyclodeaminase
MSTLLLTRSDVVRHMEALTLLSELREAFRADAEARCVEPQRARAPLHAEGTAMVLFPGTLPGIPAYTVKVHARFPGRSPAIQGVCSSMTWRRGAAGGDGLGAPDGAAHRGGGGAGGGCARPAGTRRGWR